MPQASGYGAASPPTIYQIYLGFYVIPADLPLPTNVCRVDCFRCTSPDGVHWTSPQFLASGDSTVGFYVVDQNLDPNTQYAYSYQYVFTDGSKAAESLMQSAGLAVMIVTNSVNVENLAEAASTVGLVTAGTFRGTIFQTAATPPIVQMDPSGIWAVGPQGPMFTLNAMSGSVFIRSMQMQTSLYNSAVASTPAASDYLHWTNPSTGLLDGTLVVERDMNTNYVYTVVAASAESSSDHSEAWLLSTDETGTNRTSFHTSQSGDGASSGIYFDVGTVQYTLFDQTGASVFYQNQNILTFSPVSITLTAGSASVITYNPVGTVGLSDPPDNWSVNVNVTGGNCTWWISYISGVTVNITVYAVQDTTGYVTATFFLNT